MILPQTAEYAIRAVTALAQLSENEEEAISAEEISEQSDVPLPYLSKILRRLVEANILTAKRGVGGGFVFARPLNKITLMDVLTAVNCEFDEDHCPFGWKACNHKNPCPLHNSYSKLKSSYLNWACNTTVASVVKSK